MLWFLPEKRTGDVKVRLGGILKSSDKSLLVLTHSSMVNILWKKVQEGFVETFPVTKENEEGVRSDWLCWFCQVKPWALQEAELHVDCRSAGDCHGFEMSRWQPGEGLG